MLPPGLMLMVDVEPCAYLDLCMFERRRAER